MPPRNLLVSAAVLVVLLAIGIALAAAPLHKPYTTRECSAAYTPGDIFQLPDATATRHGKVAGLLVLVAFLGWDVRRRRMPPADRGTSGVTTQPG